VADVERVILWDVDGTLVHTAGVGAAAFATAVESLFGVPAGGHGDLRARRDRSAIAQAGGTATRSW
jgi:phosphoglycolate phosphatase-like HAD superfamily hydrolase